MEDEERGPWYDDRTVGERRGGLGGQQRLGAVEAGTGRAACEQGRWGAWAGPGRRGGRRRERRNGPNPNE
jgi:hypothetical protein